MKRRNILFSVLMLVTSGSLFGQAAPPADESTDASKGGGLFGLVIDKTTNQPVEFATIGLYNSNDSSLVTGTITDYEGNFKIEQVPFGDYYMDVRFIGYSNTRINNLALRAGQGNREIGEIPLQQATTALEEVEIVAERAAVEYKIDKKVINVGQSVAAAGGTAIDVLETSPGIQTDINGDVLLRGSSSFTVLIDGKPSVLEGNDALRQLPASAIQSLEIITNPSAKYDPDGTAGIINVVTKKNRMNGLTGLVNASLYNTKEYRTDVTLNYRLNKLNLFGGIELNERPSPGTFDSYRETYIEDTTRILASDGTWGWNRGGKRFKFGGDYNISDNSVLTVGGSIGDRVFGYNNVSRFHEYTMPFSEEKYYLQQNDFISGGIYYSLNVNYQHKFNENGHEISGNIDFSDRAGDELNEAIEREADSNFDILGLVPGRLRSSEISGRKRIRYKLDYTLPMGEKSRFEAGYQGQYNEQASDYDWESFDPDLFEWIPDAQFSNDVNYLHNNQGGYAIFNNQNRIVDFQAGIRTEYTDRIITSITLDEEYRVHRLDFFPSFSLSKKLPSDHQLQASYSRRINRPRGWNLDPYATYLDPQRIRRGNPLLEPEFVDSYEMNYMKTFGKNYISFETYYRKTNGKIERVNEINDDNIMVMTFVNISQDYSVGSEANASINFTEWWTVMGSFNVFRYQVDATNIGNGVRASNSWNSRLNNTIKLKWGTRIQFSGFVRGRTVSAQGERDGFMMTNLGIRQDFLNRKLNVTLTVRDLFGTMKFNNISQGTNFYAMDNFGRQARVVGLSLSYSINNFKQDNRRSDMIEMDMGEGGGF